jgi:hypothetical protein
MLKRVGLVDKIYTCAECIKEQYIISERSWKLNNNLLRLHQNLKFRLEKHQTLLPLESESIRLWIHQTFGDSDFRSSDFEETRRL